MRSSPNKAALLVLPGLLFLAVSFLVPLAGVLVRSFDARGRLSVGEREFSLVNYVELLSDPLYPVSYTHLTLPTNREV